MKNLYKYIITLFLIGLFIIPVNDQLNAGNKDRSGQAGAGELLINPWARSSGWGNVGTACVHGVEATFGNIAGIAFTQRTDLNFSYTDWMKGSDIGIYAFGLAQKVGEAGVLSISVMSMAFGDIEITTVDLPEGGIGTFSPKYLNFALGYAKAFSNSIYGGLNIKLISESISDAKTQGVSIDAGIQYVTGELENIKFGIALKNVGPSMKFSGDGYTVNTTIGHLEQRSSQFELPTALNIGFAYDFLFSESRFTLAGNFTSNSFTKDQFTLGGEYSLKSYLMLRAAYTYEEGITKGITDEERTNALKGPSAGLSVQVPLNKEKGSVFSVDYSYRPTDQFNGTHSIGAKISF
ncbi:MAG: PorV/PorQ family protein [Bacteroidales bacterium]|nr:PorV/PorQ family protein [Bacteroidales bacterium]